MSVTVDGYEYDQDGEYEEKDMEDLYPPEERDEDAHLYDDPDTDDVEEDDDLDQE